jgi:hypothetical protein
VKIGFTPVTQHDRGKADAAGRVENPGHRAVPLPVMAQPMLHPPNRSKRYGFSAERIRPGSYSGLHSHVRCAPTTARLTLKPTLTVPYTRVNIVLAV